MRTTARKLTTLAVLTSVVALLAACTPPSGPAPVDWKVRPVSISVVNGEDNDAGDEPYVIQLGFRSKLGVPGSSAASITSQCRTGTLPAPDAGPDGSTVAIPVGGADTSFGTVQNLDLGDVLLGTAPLEILGTLTFAVERDAFFQSCALTDALELLLAPVLADALETLIANSPVPPTQEQLIALITDNLGNFLGGLGGLIGAVIEGLGNPDDIIGVAAQIHLPTAGAFTGLLQGAFGLAGLFNPDLADGFIPLQGLSSALRIRVGTLTPSQVDIPLETPGIASYVLRSSVVAG